jgi:NifB/MoaA-like Fe-S oxidoreductase
LCEFAEYLEELDETDSLLAADKNGRHVSIATGTSVHNYINQMALELQKRYNYLKLEVFPIKNSFFGENVTVTGLLTGGDIVAQLAGRELGSEHLISRSMLRSGEEVLLDDNTISDIGQKLGVKVTVVDNSGRDFIDKVLGID